MKLPGTFKMDDQQYRYTKAYSESAISDAKRSLPYYRDKRVTKKIEYKETPSLKDGIAAHCALLEPDTFEEQYVPCDGTITKKVRGPIEEHGKIPISRKNYDLFKSQAEYIRAHKVYGPHFAGGLSEHVIMWDQDGHQCKTKPDHLNDGPSIVSVKTMGSSKAVDLDDFRQVCNESSRSGWRVGTGWQSIACMARYGVLPTFYYLVCRLAYPHEDNVRMYRVPMEEVEYSVELCQQTFKKLIRAVDTDVWAPPADDRMIDLVTPEWQRRIDQGDRQ